MNMWTHFVKLFVRVRPSSYYNTNKHQWNEKV